MQVVLNGLSARSDSALRLLAGKVELLEQIAVMAFRPCPRFAARHKAQVLLSPTPGCTVRAVLGRAVRCSAATRCPAAATYPSTLRQLAEDHHH